MNGEIFIHGFTKNIMYNTYTLNISIIFNLYRMSSNIPGDPNIFKHT